MTSVFVRNMAVVEELLPAATEEFAHPVDIHRKFELGTVATVRLMLRRLERAGRAQSVLVMNSKRRMPMRLFRRAG